MSEHPTEIEGFDSLEDLARAVENLRYDQLFEFLMHLRKALTRRVTADKAAGRKKLAKHLENAAHNLLNVCVDVQYAWNVCRPYMKENTNPNPPVKTR